MGDFFISVVYLRSGALRAVTFYLVIFLLGGVSPIARADKLPPPFSDDEIETAKNLFRNKFLSVDEIKALYATKQPTAPGYAMIWSSVTRPKLGNYAAEIVSELKNPYRREKARRVLLTIVFSQNFRVMEPVEASIVLERLVDLTKLNGEKDTVLTAFEILGHICRWEPVRRVLNKSENFRAVLEDFLSHRRPQYYEPALAMAEGYLSDEVLLSISLNERYLPQVRSKILAMIGKKASTNSPVGKFLNNGAVDRDQGVRDKIGDLLLARETPLSLYELRDLASRLSVGDRGVLRDLTTLLVRLMEKYPETAALFNTDPVLFESLARIKIEAVGVGQVWEIYKDADPKLRQSIVAYVRSNHAAVVEQWRVSVHWEKRRDALLFCSEYEIEERLLSEEPEERKLLLEVVPDLRSDDAGWGSFFTLISDSDPRVAAMALAKVEPNFLRLVDRWAFADALEKECILDTLRLFGKGTGAKARADLIDRLQTNSEFGHALSRAIVAGSSTELVLALKDYLPAEGINFLGCSRPLEVEFLRTHPR
jgi:hypothetical protein